MVIRYMALMMLYNSTTYQLHVMELPQQFSDRQSCTEYVQYMAPQIEKIALEHGLDIINGTCLQVAFEPPV